ncbi:zinc transporter 2-like [Oncorhynchus tshawytscha]|uniref:Probable proton-coupled zinc antiporter SLC30A3 n=1 Tax=Oncorhynchus tshawytscha TaxID=74940 RepID=A0A8C8LZ40_ONCTS|nr:zinc transporter 2-like [Oncorhynchus tshawytscha]
MDSQKHRLIEDDTTTYSMPLLGSFPGSEQDKCPSPTAEAGDRTAAAVRWLPVTATGHCHENDRASWTESREKQLAKRKLIIASVVSLVFMVGEVIGGYAAHSLAVMTDAAHLLTDFGSIMVSLFSLWVSSRPPTKTMNFGWHRSEILGACLSVLSIWAVTGVLVFIAVQRILNDDFEIHSQIMLITSGCAVGVNVLMALILHQSSHSHGPSYHRPHDNTVNLSHGHSHGLPGGHGNTSVRAAFIHAVGDLLQSLGVLLAATIIHFWPQYKIADPICTFMFSVFVLGTTVTILKDVFRILMEGVPKGIDFNTVREMLLSLRGVKTTHNLHMWALTLSQSQLSVHVAIEEDASPQQVLMDATKLLQSEFGFSSITIQVEQYAEEMIYCMQCQDPTD